jgi:hypothetical protein
MATMVHKSLLLLAVLLTACGAAHAVEGEGQGFRTRGVFTITAVFGHFLIPSPQRSKGISFFYLLAILLAVRRCTRRILTRVRGGSKWLRCRLCSLTGAAGQADAIIKPKTGPKPAPSCSTGVDSKSCKDLAGCVWCEATFGPGKKPKGSCYDEVMVYPASQHPCMLP